MLLLMFDYGLRWRQLDLQLADMQERMTKKLALCFMDIIGLRIV